MIRTALIGVVLCSLAGIAAGQTPVDSALSATSPTLLVEEPSLREDEAALASGPRSYRVWAGMEYLLWWMKPVCLKPYVLMAGNPADKVPGAIGQPGTSPILGNHKFEYGPTSGIRPSLGMWLTPDQDMAVVVEGIILEQAQANQGFASANGSPATYIPFQLPTNAQSALPFTVPGVVAGSTLETGMSRLWGVESDFSYRFTQERGGTLLAATFLAGFRYLDLTDHVTMANELHMVADPSMMANGLATFTTRNQFYGPQVGTRLAATRGRWTGEFLWKMAMGATHQVRDVSGTPLLMSTAGTALLPGPFLALPSNLGRETADRVTLLPEIALRGRWQITDLISLSLGYSLIYWNKVLCPGDQMDSHVNPTQLPFKGPVVGDAVPAPLFVHTDYFAQGLDLGLQVRY